MFQFLRQSNINGTLYFAGARGGIEIADPIRIGDDIHDLYRIDFVGCQAPLDIRLKYVTHQTRIPNRISSQACDRSAAVQLCLGKPLPTSPRHRPSISVQAWSCFSTPANTRTPGQRDSENGRVAAQGYGAGWQSDVLPGARFLGPYSIPEERDLPGRAGQTPVTKVWIEHDETQYSAAARSLPIFSTGAKTISTFRNFEGRHLPAPGVQRRSGLVALVRAAAMRVRANGDTFGDGSFPGGHTKTLVGIGESSGDRDLGDVKPDVLPLSNMGGVVSSLQFLKTGTNDDCDYYSYRPDIFWDLDRSDQYAKTGLIVEFKGTELDGPSVLIPIKAVQPLDDSTGYTTFALKVTNVAPTISPWGIFNSLNQQLGVDVPFFLQRLPVTMRASFTDPASPTPRRPQFNGVTGRPIPATSSKHSATRLGESSVSCDSRIVRERGIATVSLSRLPTRIRTRTPSRHKSRS